MKHTPGPWEYFDVPEDKLGNMGYYAITTPHHKNRLSGVFFPLAKTYKLENAKLIAAAPLLLETIKTLGECCEEALNDGWDRSDDGFEAMLQQCRQAIAAAT